jgi:endonuclease G
VAVPEAFFKIIIDENEGRLRTLALLVPQDAPADAEPARYLTTIAEIQRRTGLDFLSEIEDDAERAIEAQRAGRLW